MIKIMGGNLNQKCKTNLQELAFPEMFSHMSLIGTRSVGLENQIAN